MLKKLFLVAFLVLALAGVAGAQDAPSGDFPAENPGDFSVDVNTKGDSAGVQMDINGRCTVNGVEVDCDQVLEKVGRGAGAFLGFGLAFMLIMFVVGILAFIFWIMMLVHAIKYPIENKVLWLLLILLTGIIGAIVYYFAVKKDYGKAAMPMNMPPTNPPPSAPPSGMAQ